MLKKKTMGMVVQLCNSKAGEAEKGDPWNSLARQTAFHPNQPEIPEKDPVSNIRRDGLWEMTLKIHL